MSDTKADMAKEWAFWPCTECDGLVVAWRWRDGLAEDRLCPDDEFDHEDMDWVDMDIAPVAMLPLIKALQRRVDARRSTGKE